MKHVAARKHGPERGFLTNGARLWRIVIAFHSGIDLEKKTALTMGAIVLCQSKDTALTTNRMMFRKMKERRDGLLDSFFFQNHTTNHTAFFDAKINFDTNHDLF